MAKNKIKSKLEIIALLLLIIATLLGVIFVKKSEVFELDEDCLYFVDGMDYSVPAGSILKVDNKTSDVTISVDESSIEPNGLPLYYQNTNALLLVNDMAYYRPNSGYTDAYKLSYFTKLELDKDAITSISRDTQANLENSGFLFDGDNSYVFLEEVILEFDDFNTKLSPYSYVIVSKGNWVEYYDYQNKEVVFEYCENNVSVRNTKGLYSLLLDLDILDLNSTQIMLDGNLYAKDLYFEAMQQ